MGVFGGTNIAVTAGTSSAVVVPAFDITGYTRLRGMVNAVHATALFNAYIELSFDGTNYQRQTLGLGPDSLLGVGADDPTRLFDVPTNGARFARMSADATAAATAATVTMLREGRDR